MNRRMQCRVSSACRSPCTHQHRHTPISSGVTISGGCLKMLPCCLCQAARTIRDRVLFEGTIKQMKVEVFWIEGGSHGLTVKGRSEESVLDDVVNLQVITWMNKRGA